VRAVKPVWPSSGLAHYAPQSIGAWTGLPIEAVTVWIAVTHGTIIVFEIVKIWQASGKSARHAFLGKPALGKDQ